MVITIKINKEREGEIILTQMIHKMNISLWGWLGGGVEGLALVCQSSSCGKLTKFTKTDPPGCLASQGCVFCFLLVSETCQYLVIPLITQPILEENAKNSYFKPNYTERSFWTFLKVEDLDCWCPICPIFGGLQRNHCFYDSILNSPLFVKVSIQKKIEI